jgi:hypothetical protein
MVRFFLIGLGIWCLCALTISCGSDNPDPLASDGDDDDNDDNNDDNDDFAGRIRFDDIGRKR